MDNKLDRGLFAFAADTDADVFTGYPEVAGFKGDHETGRDAAAAINEKIGRLKRLVRDAIAASGAEGLTPEECAEKTGIPRVSVQPRFSELKLLGVIVPSGVRRTNPSSGKSAVVWIAIEPVQGEAA